MKVTYVWMPIIKMQTYSTITATLTVYQNLCFQHPNLGISKLDNRLGEFHFAAKLHSRFQESCCQAANWMLRSHQLAHTQNGEKAGCSLLCSEDRYCHELISILSNTTNLETIKLSVQSSSNNMRVRFGALPGGGGLGMPRWGRESQWHCITLQKHGALNTDEKMRWKSKILGSDLPWASSHCLEVDSSWQLLVATFCSNW